ncbi:MAG: 3-oxocholest-4-en-26-oyl-CoA dehydrogenase alpha subunit, partial [Acidimicrobiaceae bacterium]
SYADYIWMAVRTDPDAPKHKGISIMLVPTTDPGFSYTKINTMVNASTFNTYYEDVRVGDDAIVMGLNRGWDLITNQLNYERLSLAPPGMMERNYEDTVRWAQETKLADGRTAIEQEWVQTNLARVRAGMEYLKLINWKVASGSINPAIASSAKVFGTEFFTQGYRLLLEVLGQSASDEAAVRLRSRMERSLQGALILTFGGGTNEVQRDLIALFGLHLPRIPRH